MGQLLLLEVVKVCHDCPLIVELPANEAGQQCVLREVGLVTELGVLHGAD